jgi:hypothetical protein
LNDRWPEGSEPPGPPDLGPTLGTWLNCDLRTGEIRSLTLVERDGGLVLRAFAAGDSDPIDWGETPATPYVSSLPSRAVSGFEARYDFTFAETHLAANIKYGVLVIQCYNRFLDGSGRPSYFTREFFHQELNEGPARAQGSTPAGVAASLPYTMASDWPDAGSGPASGRIDLSGLLGRWCNTHQHSRGIREVTLSREAGHYYLHAAGVDSDRDWGRVRVVPHASDVSGRDPAGFLARYDFGFSELTLAANVAKGLLIIAAFSTFRDDSSRASYFTREFYYRDSGGQTNS